MESSIVLLAYPCMTVIWMYTLPRTHIPVYAYFIKTGTCVCKCIQLMNAKFLMNLQKIYNHIVDIFNRIIILGEKEHIYHFEVT